MNTSLPEGVFPTHVWARLVKERDKYTCQECGLAKGAGKPVRPLHAHHRIPLSRQGRNVLSNGITLCSRCHGPAHKREGYQRIEKRPPQLMRQVSLRMSLALFDIAERLRRETGCSLNEQLTQLVCEALQKRGELPKPRRAVPRSGRRKDDTSMYRN